MSVTKLTTLVGLILAVFVTIMVVTWGKEVPIPVYIMVTSLVFGIPLFGNFGGGKNDKGKDEG